MGMGDETPSQREDMDRLSFSRSRWKKKPVHRSSRLSISLLTLLSVIFIVFIVFSCNRSSRSLLSVSRKPLAPQFPQCSGQALEERFLWYAPHSGFSNQLSEFKNAILMAAILNRTLIVPPVLDHHAVALGSCPKFRVSNPSELRMAVWEHAMELIRNRRYISMADIIDLSSLKSSFKVQTMDFREFVSLWCGVNFDFTCFNGSSTQSSLFESLRQCGSLLSGLDGNVDKCLYALDEDCRTTVWTYKKEDGDGLLDSFQPDEQLKKKKKILYVRRRRDVYRTLGPGSTAELATVLAFGSLFTAPYKGSELYIDIHEAPSDQRIQSVLHGIEFLPFAPEIMSAGRKFALEIIKAPFICAQLRLLDGQFKNHWKATFLGLKEILEPLRQRAPLPVHIFVMTDLPEGNWTGIYLGDLARDTASFKMHVLREDDELVIQAAKKLLAAGHSKRSGLVPKSMDQLNEINKHCPLQLLPDILLYIEETVCSCASLGFSGTAGSTIAVRFHPNKQWHERTFP
ncbi:O-fucosyltransferase 30 isoform X2 [Malania oleifera]|uniref:O-fucosyltransferase 30 isoform X2 n=1 Tax=Malania oleifera TaxID=397392 RepID=UPI0025AEBFDC|nr:O-fucosyltransferase 30 isoform X2 [Malania oleifera]